VWWLVLFTSVTFIQVSAFVCNKHLALVSGLGWPEMELHQRAAQEGLFLKYKWSSSALEDHGFGGASKARGWPIPHGCPVGACRSGGFTSPSEPPG